MSILRSYYFFFKFHVGVLLVIGLLHSCSPSEDRAPSRNASQFYRAGFPEVTANAAGFINQSQKSSLSVFVQLAIPSIIVKQEGDESKASALLEVTIDRVEGEMSNRLTKAYTIDVLPSVKQNASTFDFSQQFEVEPGFYRILVQLTDEQSMKTASVAMETTVPDLNSTKPELSSLAFLVKSKNQSEYKPYLTYSIPRQYDTLRIYSQLITAGLKAKEVHIQINRILSDSSHARRLHEPDVLPGQLPFVGIDYRKSRTIYSKKINIYEYEFAKLAEISDQIPMPEVGNYSVQMDALLGDTLQLNRKWYFAVQPAYFPKIRTARELAEPLAYLMDDKEHRAMMKIKNPDSLKMAIDSFWIKFLGNSRTAKQSLQLYYERVEQANRQFTTFKEGWKTDPGMILILFGAPRIVDQVFRDVIWAYGMYQNQNFFDPTTTFIFVRVQATNDAFPFEHYVIRRDPRYFQTLQQILDEWRTGNNLIN